jgi:F-box-like
MQVALQAHSPMADTRQLDGFQTGYSLSYKSTIDRVLAIPELLDMIFSYGTKASNAFCACVCRRWSEVALDNLWREVDNMYCLFGLLAPLEERAGPYVVSYVCTRTFLLRVLAHILPIHPAFFKSSDTGRLGPILILFPSSAQPHIQ